MMPSTPQSVVRSVPEAAGGGAVTDSSRRTGTGPSVPIPATKGTKTANHPGDPREPGRSARPAPIPRPDRATVGPMTMRDEPPDPREVLEAAEAAHLAARRGGRSGAPPAGARPGVPGGPSATAGRSRQAQTPPAPRRAPLPLAAAVAAAWAALVTFLPVAAGVGLLMALEQGSGAGAALRVAAAGWLLGHGVPVRAAAGPVGLAPLALTALAAWRVARAGLHVVRARRVRGSGSLGHCLAAAVAV